MQDEHLVHHTGMGSRHGSHQEGPPGDKQREGDCTKVVREIVC